MLALKIVICVVEDFKVFGEKVKAMPRVRFKMPRAELEPTISCYVSRAPFPSFSLLLGSWSIPKTWDFKLDFLKLLKLLLS